MLAVVRELAMLGGTSLPVQRDVIITCHGVSLLAVASRSRIEWGK
jgi:hypothetical protein